MANVTSTRLIHHIILRHILNCSSLNDTGIVSSQEPPDLTFVYRLLALSIILFVVTLIFFFFTCAIAIKYNIPRSCDIGDDVITMDDSFPKPDSPTILYHN